LTEATGVLGVDFGIVNIVNRQRRHPASARRSKRFAPISCTDAPVRHRATTAAKGLSINKEVNCRFGEA
jgi:hypothetical protein